MSDYEFDDDFADDIDIDYDDDIDSEDHEIEFKLQVDRQIRVLTHKKAPASHRKSAAAWLGESGEPKAIPALRRAYKRDKDKGVRAAAEYSLGMLKALGEALSGDEEEQEEALDLVGNIINKGQYGQRTAIPTSTLIKAMMGMVISFVVFMGLGLALPDKAPAPVVEKTAEATEAPTEVVIVDPATVVTDMLALREQLNEDATTLQGQFQAITGGNDQDCEVTFNDPADYTFPLDAVEYPLLAEVADSYNSARTQLQEARQPFDESCTSLQPMAIEVANDQWGILIEAQRMLSDILTTLQDPNAAPGVDLPEITPEATVEPTPVPTATVDPNLLSTHINTLQFYLDDMNTPTHGLNNVLITYWQDVKAVGQTFGCREGFPELPADYLLTEGDSALLPEEVNTAVANFNTGMNLSRQSRALFQSACESNDFANVDAGLSAAETAKIYFDETDTALLDAR